jgi:hypothetical protein
MAVVTLPNPVQPIQNANNEIVEQFVAYPENEGSGVAHDRRLSL